jgi:SAM-dependent methyltransferase
MSDQGVCPSCGVNAVSAFYEVRGVPVHSVLLMPTYDAAVNYPRGNIHLSFCAACGFIANTDFDPSVHEYSPRYEETQGYSPTFQAFHHELAAYLLERFDLRGKRIIEIGCGKGDFLGLLCEDGRNSGVGFDPAFVPERFQSAGREHIRFVQDFYSEDYADIEADFICCKMTLEHISQTGEFVSMLRRVIGPRRGISVFFQVPDVARILDECAFWDIYYEHCSYFSLESLGRLFAAHGFDVDRVWRGFGDQYLMLAARPSAAEKGRFDSTPVGLKGLSAKVERFSCGAAAPRVLRF